MNNINTSNVTSAASLFYRVGQNATNFNVYFGNNINLSNATNTAGMFGLTSLAICNKTVLSLPPENEM